MRASIQVERKDKNWGLDNGCRKKQENPLYCGHFESQTSERKKGKRTRNAAVPSNALGVSARIVNNKRKGVKKDKETCQKGRFFSKE